MDMKAFLALPLIFLAAAAAPHTDCESPAADPSQSMPSSVVNHAADDSAMMTESNAAPAIRQILTGCGSATAPESDPSSLRKSDDDVLHGLEPSRALAPVDQPRQAPLFR